MTHDRTYRNLRGANVVALCGSKSKPAPHPQRTHQLSAGRQLPHQSLKQLDRPPKMETQYVSQEGFDSYLHFLGHPSGGTPSGS
jgi:hypothetical protein